MKRQTTICLTAMAMTVMCGCAGPKASQHASAKPESRNPNAVQAAPPALRLADHHEWVKRLMVSPPISDIQQTAATTGATSVLPIPLPPGATTNGVQYSLLVDNQTQRVWLQSHGFNGQVMNVQGPWKTDQADAAHLLHSITNPPVSSLPQK
ncbi:MAG: hypothetical protein R3C59_25365 [Planctomycetaceae bacterium]